MNTKSTMGNTTIRDCKQIQARLNEYVDGTLNGSETWAVKLHVATCAVCAQVAEELTATSRLLQTLPREEVSSGFELALARRLADVALQPRRLSLLSRVREGLEVSWARPRTRPVVGSLAAAALVSVAVLTVVYPFARPTTTATAISNAALLGKAGKIASDTADADLESISQEHTANSARTTLNDRSDALVAEVLRDTPDTQL